MSVSRNKSDDWLFPLREGPKSIMYLVDISLCGKDTVYKAMRHHVTRGYVESCEFGWRLTDAGHERVKQLLGKAGQG